MPRFQKTRLHVVTAVLCLFGLYALAGLGYAAWAHSDEAVTMWAISAVVAFVGAFAFQRYLSIRRKRVAPES